MREGEPRVLLESRTIEVAGFSAGDLGLPCDPTSSRFEGALVGLPCRIVRAEVRTASPLPTGASHKISGFRFLCCAPQTFLLNTEGIVDGKLAREQTSLHIAGPAEVD
jgi:hypothetical protein